MKRFLIACISIAAILGLAAVTWAQEASVFDSAEKIIVRVFITNTGSGGCLLEPPTTGLPCYSAFIEVRDSSSAIISANKLVVDGMIIPSFVGTTNTDGTIIPNANPFQIHNSDLTDPDVTMSIDNDTGKIYVFCTNTTPGLHVMQYNISNSSNGVCGTTLNTCTQGTFADIADTTTNYLWNCEGSGGGSTASCSLPIPVNGVCGTTLNTCTQGTFADIADTTTNYLWNCKGSGGGSTASCSLSIPVNGVCGSSNGQTLATKPTSNLCGDASLPTVSGSGPWTWTCAGTNGGNSASCSANLQSTGADLIITSLQGPGSVGGAGSWITPVTIQNVGVGPVVGSFTVKVYLASGRSLVGAQVLATYTVTSGLGVGQSLNLSIPTTVTSLGLHSWYVLGAKVDADNNIVESNEANNEAYVLFQCL